jgi:hypothetical protein
MNSQRTERGLLLKGGRADGEGVEVLVNVFFRVSAFLSAELARSPKHPRNSLLQEKGSSRLEIPAA